MKRKITITLLSLVFVTAFWFLGVDCSWFVETCPDCMFQRDIIQYRVFTIPIYQKSKDYDSDLEKVAADLGVECKHPNLVRWHKHRYWGLVYCACPCINGTDRMSGDEFEWYDDKARSIVKEMARTHPSLREEFATRILKNHDWKYWRSFLDQVKTLRDVKPAAIP